MLGSPDPRPPLASPLALALAHHPHAHGGGNSDHGAGCSACTACGCQCNGQQPSRNLLVILPPAFKNTSLDRILAIARKTYRNPALDIADLTLKFAWATPDTPPPASSTADESCSTLGPATLSMYRVHMTHLRPTLARADIMHLVVQSVRRQELNGVTITPAPAPVLGGDGGGGDPWRSATFGFINYNDAKSCFHWLTKVQAGGMVAKATVPGAGKVVSFWSPHIEIVGGGDGETVSGSVRSESGVRARSSSGSQADAHRSSPPVIPEHELFASSRTSHASDSAIDTTPSWATSLSAADEPQSWTSDQPTWASKAPEPAPAWASNVSEPAPGWVSDVPDPMPAWASAEPDPLQPSPWPASQLAPPWATHNSDPPPTWPAPTTAHPAPNARPTSPARAPSPPPVPPARWAVTISNIDPRAKANAVLGPILDPVRGHLDPVSIRQLGVNEAHGRSVMFVFGDARAARRFVEYLCARKMARGLDEIAREGGEVVVGKVERDRGEDGGE